MFKTIYLWLVCSALCLAQQAPSAGAAPMPNSEVYLRAMKIAQGDAANPQTNNMQGKARSKKKIEADPNPVDTVQVEREKPLPPTARTALALSQAWLVNGPLPESRNGRVLFKYGQTLPTVVCAIFQVCEIDLEPGEKINQDALDWGDNRFQVASRTAGMGPEQFTYIVVKPTQASLDTTLTIGTDRRSYYIRLLSTSSDHMARVAFSYPDEEERQKRVQQAAKEAGEKRAAGEAERLAKLNTVGPIRNWNYTVQLHGRDAKFLQPVSIGDDGIHTHIKLPDQARYRGLPVIEISDAQGPIPANTHWEEGNELIVDALFENACLIEGVGRKQQRACIKNNGLKGKAN